MPALPGNSRPPTLDECETIIKHLQAANNQQSHELDRIKADLRDVLYSHKWTPDAFLLARAYVVDEKEAKRLCIIMTTVIICKFMLLFLTLQHSAKYHCITTSQENVSIV